MAPSMAPSPLPLQSPSGRDISWFKLPLAAIWTALLCVPMAAVPLRSAAAPDAWDRAVRLRDQLDGSPAERRSREQYEEVLDAFRSIYHQKPTAAKAPAAVAAVADLLAEKGRVLNDQRALRAAIGQYEFLREQYPRSPQVDNALLLEGEICRQDLKDTACAQEKLRAVIEANPGSSFAEQATIELKEMESGNSSSRKNGHKAAADSGSSIGKSPGSAANASPAPEIAADAASTRGKGKSQSSRVVAQDDEAQPDSTSALESPVPPDSESSTRAKIQTAPGRVVMITGMRHWSNPTSTRIAIDLGGKVEYEAARVPNPDRIFFDLHGARLAPNLNGHQVEVIDDGYLKRIRAAQFHPDVTRVVLDVTDVSQYSAFLLPNPWRLIIDIHSDKSAGKVAFDNGTAATIGPSQPVVPQPGRRPVANPSSADSTIADVARLSNEPAKIPATAGPTSGPVSARVPSPALSSDAAVGSVAGPTVKEALPSAQSPGTASTAGRRKAKNNSAANGTGSVADVAPMPRAADPTSDGQRSLVRALGLKVGRIVIDAGHGGHDSGTLGPGGIQEKDVVLDVALRTGKLLHQRLGAEIVYTRDDDTFIPLETRTAIANKAQADLFLSIHGNSSPEPSARGVETYYLNFTSDPNALEVAARENAVSNQSVHQLSDLVRKITLKDKIDESREFAADVDAGLYAGLKTGNPGLRDRGVKKAPFVVLIGAQMPSILAEISFLTNPEDADELRQGSYRQRIAEALDAGVERYLRGLSGTGPTKSTARSAGKNPAKDDEEPSGN